jgi:hypothetical protein
VASHRAWVAGATGEKAPSKLCSNTQELSDSVTWSSDVILGADHRGPAGCELGGENGGVSRKL